MTIDIKSIPKSAFWCTCLAIVGLTAIALVSLFKMEGQAAGILLGNVTMLIAGLGGYYAKQRTSLDNSNRDGTDNGK